MDYPASMVDQPRTYYAKRKATGRCAQARCRSRSEPGRSKCQKHLRTMSAHALKMRRKRIRDGLCTRCGKRPQFWGRKCIVCRQTFAASPLPKAALKALRLYRESETRRQLEESQHTARLAALKLIDTGKINGKRAAALRLYVGMDNGKWRTYKEVGACLNVSIERVRQLLLPAKVALRSMLEEQVAWPALKGKPASSLESERPLTRAIALSCPHEGVPENQNEPVAYRIKGLPNIRLSGLTATRCQICHKQEVLIPAQPELRKTIARAILGKPAPLSGLEFQFLRKMAALTIENLAQRLGVVPQTIVLWEASSLLRLPNDITARMYFASVLFGQSLCVDILKLFDSIRWSKAETLELRVQWHATERRWECLKATNSNDAKVEDATNRGRTKIHCDGMAVAAT